ncbi:MAG TPA: hypothetical protein VLA09_03975, partial [Longimicrobiales bacterium]|nr:hypothetical protein [Longimicrobiales bacterium]
AESLTAALEGKADKRAIARELAAQPIRSGTDLEAGVLFGSQETPSLLVLLVGLRPTALRSRRARARAGVTFASLR